MLAALLIGAVAAADAAKPHDHTGKLAAYAGAPPPVTLAADELAKLEAGEVVLKQQQSGNGGRGVAVFHVRASADTVWRTITNFAMYPKWVDNVAVCENYANDGTHIRTRFVLDPFGMNVEYFIHHVYRPAQGYMTWTLDYTRLSDFDDSVGYWRVTPVSTTPPVTRVEYSVGILFKGYVPGFVADMVSEKGLRNATQWVRKQAEGG
ncbi:MAG: SRPBCC family protein [Myxococcota bacterium]